MRRGLRDDDPEHPGWVDLSANIWLDEEGGADALAIDNDEDARRDYQRVLEAQREEADEIQELLSRESGAASAPSASVPMQASKSSPPTNKPRRKRPAILVSDSSSSSRDGAERRGKRRQ